MGNKEETMTIFKAIPYILAIAIYIYGGYELYLLLTHKDD